MGNKQPLAYNFSPKQRNFRHQQIMILKSQIDIALSLSLLLPWTEAPNQVWSQQQKQVSPQPIVDMQVQTHKPLPFSHYSLNKLSADTGKTPPAPVPISGTDNKKNSILIWKSWPQL